MQAKDEEMRAGETKEPAPPAAGAPPPGAAPPSDGGAPPEGGTVAAEPRRRRPATSQATFRLYAGLALGAFLAGTLLLILLLTGADRLAALGLAGGFFYAALIPLALTASLFLFGILRSYASYQGKALQGSLELGGPAVVFLLVLLLGNGLAPESSFSATVYLHGPAGRQDLPLRGQGKVFLDLGADRRDRPIGANGEAVFLGIPAEFRGRPAAIAIEADLFALAAREVAPLLQEGGIYLEVRRLDFEFRGRAQAEDGEPVAGAKVRACDREAVTTDDGSFVLLCPGAFLARENTLSVQKDGYRVWRQTIIAGSNEIVAVLVPLPAPAGG